MSKTIKRIRNILRIAALFLPLVALATGCLTKENTMTLKERVALQAQPNTLGFTGLLKAETIGETKVRLSWAESLDSSVTHYVIYEVSERTPKEIKILRTPATFYTLNNLIPGNFYVFRVKALNSKGKEDTNTVDIPAIPYGGAISGTALTSSTAEIQFANATNADQLRIYCKTALSSPPDFALMKTITNPTSLQTKVVIENLESGQEYTCRAAMVKITGEDEGSVFVDNNPFTVTFTPTSSAKSIAFVRTPGETGAGEAFTLQPIIHVLDASGKVLTSGPDASAKITLTVSNTSPTTGELKSATPGIISMNAVRGVADFSGKGLFIESLGQKKLTAEKSNTINELGQGSAVMTAESGTFKINAGSISPQDSSIVASPLDPANPPLPLPVGLGETSGYKFTITLRDKFQNPIDGIRPELESSLVSDNCTTTTNCPAHTIKQATKNTGVATPPSTTPVPGVTVAWLKSSTVGKRSISVKNYSEISSEVEFKHGSAKKLAYLQQPTGGVAGVTLGTGTPKGIRVVIQDEFSNPVLDSRSDVQIKLVPVGSASGTLSGTTTQKGDGKLGIALFQDLLVGKSGWYKFAIFANDLGTEWLTSNDFEITSGGAGKLAFTKAQGTAMPAADPLSINSGGCVSLTIQLQDMGGNPTSNQFETKVGIRNFKSADFFNNSTCSGSKITPTQGYVPVSVAIAQSDKTISFRNLKSELMKLEVFDLQNSLGTGSKTVHVYPTKMNLSGFQKIKSGECESFQLDLLANDNSYMVSDSDNSGVYVDWPFTFGGGLADMKAGFFEDGSCSPGPGNTSSFQIQKGELGLKNLFFKANGAGTVTLSISDGRTSVSAPATKISGATSMVVDVLPSNLRISSPVPLRNGMPTKRAGDCLQLTIDLLSASGDHFATRQPIPLTVSGLGPQGSPLATLHGDESSCIQGTGGESLAVIAENQNSTTVFIRSQLAQELELQVKDARLVPDQIEEDRLKLTDSNALKIRFIPSKLQIEKPVLLTLLRTSECSPAFQVTTRDQRGQKSPVIYPLKVALSGANEGGAFFSDLGCTQPITELNFAPAQDTQSFYFKTLTPAQNLGSDLGNDTLTFTATDQTHIAPADQSFRLAQASTTFEVRGSKSWIGTRGETDAKWFQKGMSVVGRRLDGIQQVKDLALDLNGDALYVADFFTHSVRKYKYSTGELIGWIGGVTGNEGAGTTPEGSKITGTNSFIGDTFNTLCSRLSSGQATPGWCFGGLAGWVNDGWTMARGGAQYRPAGIAFSPAIRDGQTIIQPSYIFVTQEHHHSVQRYNAETGEFAGWIGRMHDYRTDGAHLTSSPANDTRNAGSSEPCKTAQQSYPAGPVTPGWCYSGHPAWWGWEWGRPQTCGTSVNSCDRNTHGNNINSSYSQAVFNAAGNGGLDHPNGIAYHYDRDSGAGYIYVGSHWLGAVNRYRADTGEFAGWVGRIAAPGQSVPNIGALPEGYLTTPTGNGPDVPSDIRCQSAVSTTTNLVGTPGWCMGGVPTTVANWQSNHDFSRPGFVAGMIQDIKADASSDTLYVLHRYAQFTTISAFGLKSGAFKFTRRLDSESTGIRGIGTSFALTPTEVYVSDLNRVAKYSRNAIDTAQQPGQPINSASWMGKIKRAQNCGVTGLTTPGWCSQGDASAGFEEGAFVGAEAVAVDLNQNLLITGEIGVPRLQRFELITGLHQGTAGSQAVSPSRWRAMVDDPRPVIADSMGFNDQAMAKPQGIVSSGSFLYVSEFSSQRIKKLMKATGEVVGWIGSIISKPTSGESSFCQVLSAFVVSNMWCRGMGFEPETVRNQIVPIDTLGALPHPAAMTSGTIDGVEYLYSVDLHRHRIIRHRAQDGEYLGWIGWMSSVSGVETSRENAIPHGGGAQCTSSSSANKFSPGWCLGGSSMTISRGDDPRGGQGALHFPQAIVFHNGFLYTHDRTRGMIQRFDARTGAFRGWIGVIEGTNGLDGDTSADGACKTAQAGSRTPGWCRGGLSRSFLNAGDTNWDWNNKWNSNSTVDLLPTWGWWWGYDMTMGQALAAAGDYLYVANNRRGRIDRFLVTTGVFAGSVDSREDMPTSEWSMSPVINAADVNRFINGMWIDPATGNLYQAMHHHRIVNRNLNNGQVIGWQGMPNQTQQPNQGACENNREFSEGTAGWCRGGWFAKSPYLGGFETPVGITGDKYFIYVTDSESQRIYRIPR